MGLVARGVHSPPFSGVVAKLVKKHLEARSMTARFSWNQRNTRGHRPRLQSISAFCNTFVP
jgi:hypothetical protein